MASFLRQRNAGLIGCAVSAGEVRLLQLSTVRPNHLGVQAFGRQIVNAGADARAAQAAAIDLAMRSGPFTGRHCASVLPEATVRYRPMRLGAIPAGELASAVHYRVAADEGVSPDRLRTSFINVGDDSAADDAPRHVVAMFVTTSDVDGHAAMLSASGLKPTAIEAPPIAIARCFDDTHDPSRALLLIKLGLNRSKLILVKSGRPVFVHSLVIGWQDVVYAALDDSQLDGQEAERLQQYVLGGGTADLEIGSDDHDAHIHFALKAGCKRIGSILAHEVALCCHYLSERRFTDCEPRVGGLIGGKRYEETLRHEINTNACVDFEPVRELIAPRVAELLNQLPASADDDGWLLPIGAALREREHGVEDLGPAEGVSLHAVGAAPRAHRQRRVGLTVAVVAVICAIAAWQWTLRHQLRSLDAEIVRTEGRLADLQSQRAEVQSLLEHESELRQRLDAVQSMRDPIAPVAVLALLTQCAPDGVYFRQIALDALSSSAKPARSDARKPASPETSTVARVLLEGFAADDSAVTRLMGRMIESRLFQNVRLEHSRSIVFNELPCHEFRLALDIEATSAEGGAP